jgi:hypothetical protein
MGVLGGGDGDRLLWSDVEGGHYGGVYSVCVEETSSDRSLLQSLHFCFVL